MKNQISTLSDLCPSLDTLKKKKWYGRLMVNIFTFTSTNGINYTICFCLFHKIIISCITKNMTELLTEMMTRLEAVD